MECDEGLTRAPTEYRSRCSLASRVTPSVMPKDAKLCVAGRSLPEMLERGEQGIRLGWTDMWRAPTYGASVARGHNVPKDRIAEKACRMRNQYGLTLKCQKLSLEDARRSSSGGGSPASTGRGPRRSSPMRHRHPGGDPRHRRRVRRGQDRQHQRPRSHDPRHSTAGSQDFDGDLEDVCNSPHRRALRGRAGRPTRTTSSRW